MLKFSNANTKTKALLTIKELNPYLSGKRKIYSLDLLSGYSCPFAHECLSKAVVNENGRTTIQDGQHTKFRCFSASQEAIFPAVRRSREHNFSLLRQAKTMENMLALLEDSLPQNAGIVRIHVAGDFFSPSYFLAWNQLAKNHQDKLFYAYTKSLRYWIEHRKNIANNFVLTASYGGRNDELIKKNKLRFAKVVFTKKQAGKLPIDHDDSHAARPDIAKKSFALLIHGIQPKGSEASQALSKLNGEGSYGK